MSHNQIRDLIKDTLQKIGMWSQEAEELVFLTGMVESGYDYIYQIGSGIARSFWQVESATAKDCIDNYLVYRKKKLEKVCEVMHIEPDTLLEMSDEDLKQTKVTQPAIFLHSVILANCLGESFQPDMVAGHSLNLPQTFLLI